MNNHTKLNSDSMRENKTLIFCTGYARTNQVWSMRYRTWYNNIKNSGINYDQIIIFDDASPVLPDWHDFQIVQNIFDINEESKSILLSFPNHVGRISTFDCEGWFRSFSQAIIYAHSKKFERIIHIESDAFIISQKTIDYINKLNDGWNTLWSRKHNFPEMAIQIICHSYIDLAAEFFGGSYEHLRNHVHENLLPFSNVQKDLVGERYADFGEEVPYDADWATQVDITGEFNKYWFLHSKNPNFLNLIWGTKLQALKSGWSHIENHAVWSVGHESVLQITFDVVGTSHALYLDIEPCIDDGRVFYQYIEILINDFKISTIVIQKRSQLYFLIPKFLLCNKEMMDVKLNYRTPVIPSKSNSKSTDNRELTVLLYCAEVFAMY